jgi:opacity protein-like surface antigen
MKISTKLILFSLIMGFSLLNFAQDQTTEQANKPGKHKMFTNIFTGAYHSFNSQKPNTGFELSTALLGYEYKKSDDLKVTLIYDVTRTTNGFNITDSNGTRMSVVYFEGSKYTAFLKMAEIKWQFAPKLTIAAGQLLSEQYLTVDLRYWDHRYVMTTMQEWSRMAYPADFGMRLEYKDKESFAFSLSALNGDGPFRHQDDESLIEYTANLEIYKIKNFVIKGFVSYMPSTTNTKNKQELATALFAMYDNKKFKLGAEYTYTDNPNFTDLEYSGASVFTTYNINKQWEVFARYDYVDNSPVIQYGNLYLLGLQYKPEKNLTIALNYRFWQPTDVQQLYLNFGVTL